MWEHACLVAQLCLTVCDPIDCSPPGFSVHGILQARILEWVAMPSKGSSRLRDRTHVSYISCIGRWVLYHQRHLGSPNYLQRWPIIPSVVVRAHYSTNEKVKLISSSLYLGLPCNLTWHIQWVKLECGNSGPIKDQVPSASSHVWNLHYLRKW